MIPGTLVGAMGEGVEYDGTPGGNLMDDGHCGHPSFA
jgi:hypothetical protein